MSSFLRLNISPNNLSASDILGDAEDSEAAYSCLMMGKEAGCSLICMVEIHQSDCKTYGCCNSEDNLLIPQI